MKTNYHTHTFRCKHASGNDEQYIKSAITGGFSVLGFSDHTPWPFTGGYSSPIRMKETELNGYVESLRFLRARYRDQIDIKTGLECEYFPDYILWLKELRERFELDYLIFGNHFPYNEKGCLYFANAVTPSDLRLYLDSSVKGMESGLFECMAHPDLFMCSYYYFDKHCESVARELCRAAHHLNILLECNYLLSSFCREFWEIAAEENCRVIVGTDAHNPEILERADKYNQAVNNLKKTGIIPVDVLM